MIYWQNALHLLVGTLLDLLLLAAVLRFLLQWVRADATNPLSQAIIKVTNPLMRILEPFLPAFRGVSLAALAMCWLIGAAKSIAAMFIGGAGMRWGAAFAFGAADALTMAYWIFIIAIIIRAIASWFAGAYHPLLLLPIQLSEPLLAPMRRLIPSFGGLDLSPLIAILALNLARMLLIYPLVDFARALL